MFDIVTIYCMGAISVTNGNIKRHSLSNCDLASRWLVGMCTGSSSSPEVVSFEDASVIVTASSLLIIERKWASSYLTSSLRDTARMPLGHPLRRYPSLFK